MLDYKRSAKPYLALFLFDSITALSHSESSNAGCEYENRRIKLKSFFLSFSLSTKRQLKHVWLTVDVDCANFFSSFLIKLEFTSRTTNGCFFSQSTKQRNKFSSSALMALLHLSNKLLQIFLSFGFWWVLAQLHPCPWFCIGNLD